MELENKELKKPGFFSSIRFKLIVWFFLALFIPLSIGGAVLYFYSKSKIEESIINHLSSIADSRVENVNIFLSAKKAGVVYFSTDGLIRDKTELIGYYGKVKERMIDLSSHLAKNKAPLDSDILETFIMDLEGEIIASSNPQNIRLKKQNTDYFINAKRYGVYASSLHYCMDGNMPVVEISRLLTSRKSEEVKPVGVIVNRIRGNSVVDVIKNGVTVGDKSDKKLNLKIYVLDSNYQILGGSGISPASRHLLDGKSFKNTINTKLVKMFDKSGEDHIGMYENHLGLSVMGTIRHLEDLDLFILLEMDERDAFTALTRVKWSAIIISPVVFMAIIAVAFVLSTRLSRPITVMTDITGKIASGHLKDRIPVNRKDEIGLLAASFNDMTFRLEESRKQLQDYALNLEERTKELLVKNQQQEVIGKIGELLWIELDFQDLMDKVVNQVTRTLNVEFCKMLLLDKSQEFLRLASGVGWKEGLVGHATVDVGMESQAGYTLKEQKPVIIRDIRTETRFSGPPLLRDHGVVSGLSVPMIIGAHALGVMGVYTTQIRDFSNDEINFLQSVGNLMASVIEHMRVEDVLKESEDKFRKITTLAHDAIIMLNNDEKISYWNKAAERTFGYLEEEIFGKNLHEIIIPDRFRKRHLEGFEEFKSNGLGRFIGKTLKLSAIRRDGTEFPIELSLSAVKLKDKWNAIGIVRDISERKLAEKKLRMSQKMASLGRLAGGVFHEILNPLNIISAHTQLLLMNAETGSEAEKDLNSIKEEVYRIEKITNELLRFSKKDDFKIENVETNSLLEEVISIVEPEMKLKRIKIIRKFDEGLPEVEANSDGLRQVFLNLITNARDAMPDGGKITVKTKRVRPPADRAGSSEIGVRRNELGVHPSARPSPPFGWVPIQAGSEKEEVSQPVRQVGKLKGDYGDYVEISFEDTGCGIASKDIDKIFEPFFSTRKEVVGVGLGLSESHGLIEAYGGTIHVKSEKGEGSTFIIDLPC